MTVSFAPEVNKRNKRPRLNTDPGSVYLDGKPPANFQTSVGIEAAAAVASTTSASATVTIADTTGIEVGQIALGPGVSDAQNVTLQDTGDTITLAGHGAPNGTPFTLATLVTTTGLIAGQRYYVVGRATDTFQAARTPGGSAVALTTNGTGSVVFERYVSAVTEDTSITLNIPASATGADVALSFVHPPAHDFTPSTPPIEGF